MPLHREENKLIERNLTGFETTWTEYRTFEKLP